MIIINKSFKNFEKYNKESFLQELKNEWNFQDNKFPNQEHTIEKWLVIIMEEVGEMCKESLEIYNSTDLNLDSFYKEIIQAITLLIRLRYSVYSVNLIDEKIII